MSNVVMLSEVLATNRRVPAGFTARAAGFVAPAGSGVFTPLVGAPLLMSNVVMLLLVSLATKRRVLAGFTARAVGFDAPAGKDVTDPPVGAPLLTSKVVTVPPPPMK